MIIPKESLVYLQKMNPGVDILKEIHRKPVAWFGATIPYPKQAAILRTWFAKQPKITVITGWRRTSKTAIGAYIGTCYLLGNMNAQWPGARQMGLSQDVQFPKNFGQVKKLWICGKTLEHIENVLLQQYRELLPNSMIDTWFTRNTHRISLKNRTWALVRTYDQELGIWKSDTAGMIHMDEEPPLDKMTEALSRTGTSKGKILITVAIDDADVSWLPDACANPIKYFGTDDFMHFKLGIDDTPDLIYPQIEKDNLYRKYDKTLLRDAVRKGEFSYLSGRWWLEFDPKYHVITSFPIPAEWKRWRAIDPGAAAPTGAVWIAKHPQHNILFVYREYYKAGTTIAERCRDIIELSGNQRFRDGFCYTERQTGEQYENTLIDFHEFHVDPISGDSLESEYIKQGLICAAGTGLKQENRREMIRKWLWIDMNEKHFITHEPGAPRIYIFDSCPNLIWEAQKKSVKRSASDNASTSERKIDNKDDHLMDGIEGICCELSWLLEGREIF
jgi:phage terminase large subunit-like protein